MVPLPSLLVSPSPHSLTSAAKEPEPLGQWLFGCPVETWDAGGRAGDKRDGHAAAWGDVSLLGGKGGERREMGMFERKPLGSWFMAHAIDPSNMIKVRSSVFENS